MRLYARSDVVAVSIPETGHTHERKALRRNKDGDVLEYAPEFVVDCNDCEPYLIERLGFAPTPEAVEKTPDEVQDQKRKDEQAASVVREMGAELADVALSRMGQR